MSGKLIKEIRKVRPFDSVQQELFLNIIRTADFLMRRHEELFKPYGISPTQYNILRILRAAADNGMTCKGIGDHLITRDPDITRLLDRLEKRLLTTRQRDGKDRRAVVAKITPDGLKILKELDKPVLDLHRLQLKHISETKITQMIDFLEEIRHPESA